MHESLLSCATMYQQNGSLARKERNNFTTLLNTGKGDVYQQIVTILKQYISTDSCYP